MKKNNSLVLCFLAVLLMAPSPPKYDSTTGGINFTADDTAETCNVDDYKIYADLSETALKKCEAGTITVIGDSSTLNNPIVNGKLDLDGGSVDDDDCTGELGHIWFDDTDNQFELCPLNSGVPANILTGESDPDYNAEPASNITSSGSGAVLTSAERVELGKLVINRNSPGTADDFTEDLIVNAITITNIDCIVDPADSSENVVIDLNECDSTGDNCVTVDANITCDNDGATDDGSLSNAVIDAGDWTQLEIVSVTGTVARLTVVIRYLIN